MERRPFEQIVNDYFYRIHKEELRSEGRRNRITSLTVILGEIPEADYVKLRDQFREIEIFIPDEQIGAEVFHLKKNTSTLLYLSPYLEKESLESCMAMIAHELGHILLNHHSQKAEDEIAMEEEAWKVVEKWEFIGPGILDRTVLGKHYPK